jgi:hypothetical protein
LTVFWTLALVPALCAPAMAQESQLHAEVRREGERVSDACSLSLTGAANCAYTLFTDHPFHIAAGSMPPQNGFGAGAAFVWSKNTRNWRMSWDADATGAPGGAWRAGAYMKLVHTPHTAATNPIKVTIPGQTPAVPAISKPPATFTHPYIVYDFYAQSISLNKIDFYGLGNSTAKGGQSVFGMTETILGVTATKPVYEWAGIRALNVSLVGEMNGRFVSVRDEHGTSTPSIETLYSDATAPGLSTQPGFFQLGEGVRVHPTIGDFELNYLAKLQQFVAPSDSRYSFLRWTVDLNHTFYLYGGSHLISPSASTQGPDSCAPSGEDCPPIPHTRNLGGSLGARILLSESVNSASSAVPFYFQPTLGGQGLDGAMTLGSYADYRFRAPNVFLFQETFEHSIWGPLGVEFQADEGKVALTRGQIDFSNFKHSFAAGVTLRVGAFPMGKVLIAWGGPEGHHATANMDTSLLGGSSRPPLY